ncbi:MAG: isopeptide-forming domain-containing fimbrial protein, partial [Actinomycetia bacterium]|nr:isopeptide-forming domain-containing fimbrial protein [Actinomycetes bacterium]
IGEIVRYRLVVQLPQGPSENLQISDVLPAGLLFLNDGSATLALVSDDAPMASTNPAGDSLGLGLGAGAFGTPPWVNGTDPAAVNPTFVLPDVNVGDDNSLAADNDAYASGTDPWFKLGDIVNADSDADGEYVIIEFNALVMNIAGNDAGVSRANQARTYVDGSQMVQSGSVSITIAEPSITDVAKGVNPATGAAGDQVDFTVTFSNANGADNTSALDARVRDTLPADLSYFGNVNVTGGGAWVDNSAGDTVDIVITEVVKGASVTVTYSATIDVTAAPTQVITNTALLTYTSTAGPNGSGLAGSTIPGAAGESTGERDHSDGAGGLNGYTDDDDASVTVDNLTLTKSIAETSEAHTAGSTVAIGEIVRYRLVVQLPQGTSENLQI